MTNKHPLNDEILEHFGMLDDPCVLNGKRIFFDHDMRAIYDLAIDRCVYWLEDNDCDDPQKTAKTLKEAMYSQEDNS